jgi:putative ABC transport system ATP-binding protein
VERSETEQEHGAQAAGIATDLISGLRPLKGLRAEGAALDRYRLRSASALEATVRSARAEAAYRGVMLLFSGGFLAVIAVVGGVLAARGDITVGQLISSLGLAQFLVGPMSTFAWVSADFAQGRASARRIADVLQSPAALTGGRSRPVTPVQGRLTLRAVEGVALQGIDLDVAPGELVGIAATDPAAAAALVSYLGRDADPGTGTITLDGAALSDLETGALRDALLVSAHHTDLFEGTLRTNISPGNGHDIDAAVAAATVDEVAQALPDGLDTTLDEQARTLSGGQRQRVALARALAADAPVLVVHEPTTAVDTVTEARIASGLRRLRSGRTTLLVTTSPALLSATDRVVFIHDGVVAASGRHADLVGANDLYRTAVLA